MNHPWAPHMPWSVFARIVPLTGDSKRFSFDVSISQLARTRASAMHLAKERLAVEKRPSVESMLRSARENFGVTTPVLGQFVRKYMHHKARTRYDRIRIHDGKVRWAELSFLSGLANSLNTCDLCVGNDLFIITISIFIRSADTNRWNTTRPCSSKIDKNRTKG